MVTTRAADAALAVVDEVLRRAGPGTGTAVDERLTLAALAVAQQSTTVEQVRAMLVDLRDWPPDSAEVPPTTTKEWGGNKKARDKYAWLFEHGGAIESIQFLETFQGADVNWVRFENASPPRPVRARRRRNDDGVQIDTVRLAPQLIAWLVPNAEAVSPNGCLTLARSETNLIETVTVPKSELQDPHTVTSDCNREMVHRFVTLLTAMTGLQPSTRSVADPRTVRLALELLERTAGRRRRCRRRCRRCRSVIAENARKRGQAWSVCTPCARAIEDDARQLEIAPALTRRCLVCRTDIAHLRAGARTCGDACRNVLSRNLRHRRRPVSES